MSRAVLQFAALGGLLGFLGLVWFGGRIPKNLTLAPLLPSGVWAFVFTVWGLRTGRGMEWWSRIPQPRWLVLVSRGTTVVSLAIAVVVVIRYYLF
jgi:hypothetical protein